MSIFGKKQPAVTTQQYQQLEECHWRLKEQVTALTVAQQAQQITPRYERQLSNWEPQDESFGMIDRVAGRNGAGVTYIGQMVIVQPGGTYVAGNQTHTTTTTTIPAQSNESYYEATKTRVARTGYTNVTDLALLNLDDKRWNEIEIRFDSDRQTIRSAAIDLLYR